MKRPLLPVALCYAAGLLLADNLHLPLIALFICAFTVLAGACFASKLRPALLLVLVVLTGWTNLAWRKDLRSPLDLRMAFTGEPEIVTLEGRLYWPPEQRTYDYGAREATRTMAWLDVETARRQDGAAMPAVGKVLVLTPGRLPDKACKSARVHVTGVLGAPPGPEAEGLFDYRKYLARQNIHFQLRTSGIEDWQVLTPSTPSISERFIPWAKSVLSLGVHDSGQSLLLLWSMTLGARSSLDHEDYEPFVRTGTMHIFAISGLHIALIAGMLVKTLRFCRMPRACCGMVSLPLIWFYTGATGWQPSAVRAAIMSSIVIVGWALPRPSELINSLCAAALIILMWDPQQLFGASFQLSFFVVLSIAILLPRVEAARDHILDRTPLKPDVMMLPELVPFWQRKLFSMVRMGTNAAAVSFAAWVGALPLTIYYFHLFNPVTLLANLLVVPMSSIALACNMGSLVFGEWLAPATIALNKMAVILMQWIMWLCDVWAGMRWGALHVRALLPIEIGVYYLLLGGLFSGWLLQKKFRSYSACLVPAALAGWLLLQPADGQTSLTIFPTDGGMAIHLGYRGENMLVDCGKTNIVERLVGPFLQAKGINKIERLILSHGDLAHIGGAQQIEGRFRVREVVASPLKFRSPVYRECTEDFDHQGLLKRKAFPDFIGEWEVLHPAADDPAPQADAGCLVLAGSIEKTRVLLLPDLNRLGQEKLIEREADVKADIVVCGLPDHGEPLCEPLLKRVRPRMVIIGDSARPAYARAKQELVERLEAAGAQVICTSTAGVTTVRFPAAGQLSVSMASSPASTQPRESAAGSDSGQRTGSNSAFAQEQ